MKHKTLRAALMLVTLLSLKVWGAEPPSPKAGGVKPPSPIASEADAKKIEERAQSLATLIKVEKNEVRAASLRLTRATSQYQLVKIKKDPAATASLMAEIESELEQIESTVGSQLQTDQRAYIAYLRGLLRSDQGRGNEARELFRQSLKLDPKSKYAVGLSQYLADDAYGNGRDDEAQSLYGDSIKNLKGRELATALYHLATLELKEKKEAAAEAHMVQLFQLPIADQGEFRKQALVDLAGRVSNPAAAESALAKYDQKAKFTDDEKKVFLSSVLDRQSKGDSHNYQAVMETLLKKEKNPVERTRILFGAFQQAREKSDLLESGKSYSRFEIAYRGLKPDQKASVLKYIQVELKDLIETFTAKLSNEYVAKSDPKVGQLLKSLTAFAVTEPGVVREEKRVDLAKLWFDVCAKYKDTECTLRIAELVARDPKLKSLSVIAEQEKIAALESSLLTATAETKPAAQSRLLDELKSYTSHEAYPDWLRYQNRYASLLVEQSRFDDSIPVYKKADARAKTEESYYNLQLARFKAEKFADVAGDARPAQVTSERVRDLVRESLLKRAQASKSENQPFSEYELSIKQFLSLNKSPEKRLLILKDYFSRLQKLKMNQKLRDEVGSLPAHERFSKLLEPYTRSAVQEAFSNGDEKAVLKLTAVTNAKLSERPADLAWIASLAELASGVRPTTNWLKAIPAERRVYVAGLTAIALPDIYDSSFSPALPDASAAQSLSFLALKLRACRPPLKLTAAQVKKFGDLVPDDAKGVSETPSEKKIKAIGFKAVAKLTNAESAKMMKTLEQVRAARASVISEVAKLDAKSRVRVLKAAAALESGAAKFIETAPMPAGLTPDQVTQYKKGIAQLASEFTKQHDQFQAAEVAIEKKIGSEVAVEKAPSALKDAKLWTWPKSVSELRSHHDPLMKRLIILDLKKASGEVTTKEFYQARAGILLASSRCEYMAEYVYDELSSAQQTDIVNAWRSL